jgi:hypothetical protein
MPEYVPYEHTSLLRCNLHGKSAANAMTQTVELGLRQVKNLRYAFFDGRVLTSWKLIPH